MSLAAVSVQLEDQTAVLAEMKRRQMPFGIFRCTLVLASAKRALGKTHAAQALYLEALSMQQRTGFQQWAADGLEGLAGIIAAQGQGGAAARLLAAGEALRKKNAFPRWGLQQARYAEDVVNARRLLAERQWQHDWAEGEAMDLGDVIGFALESCSAR